MFVDVDSVEHKNTHLPLPHHHATATRACVYRKQFFIFLYHISWCYSILAVEDIKSEIKSDEVQLIHVIEICLVIIRILLFVEIFARRIYLFIKVFSVICGHVHSEPISGYIK